MGTNLNEAPAMSVQEAARRLEQNGIMVYRPVCYADSFSICTKGRTKDGYTARAIITMAQDLRGPATTNEEATR